MMQNSRKLTGGIVLAASLLMHGLPLTATAEPARAEVAAGDNATLLERLSLYKELAPADQSAALTYYRSLLQEAGTDQAKIKGAKKATFSFITAMKAMGNNPQGFRGKAVVNLDFAIQETRKYFPERYAAALERHRASATTADERGNAVNSRLEKEIAETDKRIAEDRKEIAETDKRIAETDKRIAETDKRIAKLREIQKVLKGVVGELKEKK
ncbi:hypothetical protein [uncultured Thiodictyon sp.]|uniref:hypothetical protein n=1 Tax=uncultured Thiodictyon sp. TaxID=1846217 RepID=UPI0025DBD931|nr:hypothetical protein [uncultured Thiodictyon sp.]